MNKTNQMFETLCAKVDAERNVFRAMMCAMKPEELYDAWYKVNFYESYHELLTSKEMLRHPKLIKWLNKFELPIEQLYIEWCCCDAHFSGLWDDMIDWLRETYESYEDNDI